MSDTLYAALFAWFAMLTGGWLAIAFYQGVPEWAWLGGFIVVGAIFTFILRIRLDRNRDGL